MSHWYLRLWCAKEGQQLLRVIATAAATCSVMLTACSTGSSPAGGTSESVVSPTTVTPSTSAAAPSFLGSWLPVDPPGHSTAFLTLTSAGTFTASDGCNDVGGTYAITPAGALSATVGGQDLRGCPGQIALRDLMTRTTSVEATADAMVWRDSADAVVQRWSRTTTSIDGSWQLDSGSVTFGADGRYTGSNGCAPLGGGYEYQPGGAFRVILPTQGTTTCATFVPLNGILRTAAVATPSNSTLVLRDRQGSVVATLTR